jgi:hypothetical protein
MNRRHKIYQALVTSFICLFTTITNGQSPPACISALKNANSTYARTVKLKDGRTVYVLNVKRPPKCMDCQSGVTYYDSSCKRVASFTIGYAPVAFIAPGYSSGDFPEAKSPMFAARLAAMAVPPCIAEAIDRPDSLVSAGIHSIEEVQMGGRKVYYFNDAKPVDKNCHDCATIVTYYDSLCRVAGSFSVGGYAGVVAKGNLSKEDYINKKKLRTLWTAAASSPPAGPSASGAINPFPGLVNFTITQVVDTILNGLAVGDELRISSAEGLSHFRNGKLVNSYKIIPTRIKQRHVNPCLIPPCPEREEEKIVYYLEPIHRYFSIEQLMDRSWFNFSRKIFISPGTPATFEEGDWVTGYRLVKKSE